MLDEKLKECIRAIDKLDINLKPLCTPPDERGDSDHFSTLDQENDRLEGYQSPDSIHEKARALYLRGRALNVTTKHDAESERLLSKSVKLEPSFVEAWQEIGESYKT